MDYMTEYSKYSLDTLYDMLSRIDKDKFPEKVNGIVSNIAQLEGDSFKYKRNKKRLKYALLSLKERIATSQDAFPCFRIVHWTRTDILFGILTLVLLYGTGSALGYIDHFTISRETLIFIYVFFYISFKATLLLVPYYICYKKDVWPLYPILSVSKFYKEFFRAIGYWFLASFSVGLIMHVVQKIGNSSFNSPEIWEWTERAPKNTYFLIFLMIGFIISPILEEIFFRGFLYNALKTHLSTTLAMIIQAAIFAMVHQYDLMNSLYVFLIGISLVIIYERRKNLLSPILVHCFINFFWSIRIWIK